MRLFLTIMFVWVGTFLSASDSDSLVLDSNYRLSDVQPHKNVDKDQQVGFVVPDEPVVWEDEWVTGPLNDGAGGLGSNYDSIHNINPKVAGFITVCFLSFVGYIVFRVWRSMRKDERNRRRF